MVRFCTNCGDAVQACDAFCGCCGAGLPLPAPPPQHTPPRASKRQIGGMLAIIASGFAVIMLFMLVVGPMISGKTLFSDKTASGKIISTGSATVSSESPVAEIDGVTVDANPLNLIDGEVTLTVERHEQVLGGDGFLGEEYDISLGDMHYLRAPVTVSLPYDNRAAQDSVVCVLHYDSDYDEWTPQGTEIDADSGTVSAKLTTLSPIRTVYLDKDYSNSVYYVKDEGSIHARMEVSYNFWSQIKNAPLEPAQIVAQDYIVNGNTNASTEQLISEADQAIKITNTYYTLFGSFADSMLGTLGNVRPALKAVGNGASRDIGIVSLIIAGGQLAFDLSTKDSTGPRNETAINLYKNIATNSGTLYSFCTGYSSAAFSSGFFAVAVTGYVLDQMVETAQKIQADTVEAVFDTYYREHSTFNERDWYSIFVNAYWNAWQNNRDSRDGMDYAVKEVTDAIDAHAERFWDEIYKDGSDALTFAVADAGKKNYYTPTLEQKAELTARFKRDMFQRFNEKTIPLINDFMMQRLQSEVFRSLLKAAKPLNDYYRVTIQEIAPLDSGTPCKYQGYTIRFVCSGVDGLSFPSSDYPEEWTLVAPEDDDEWAVQTDFTMQGYIEAGQPNAVALFPPGGNTDDLSAAERVAEFTLNTLESGTPNVIDLSGQAEAAYVWALTSIEPTDMLGSLSNGARNENGIYEMNVELSVSETELSIQCTKDTVNGPQSAQARLQYPAMIMPDVEGGLTASASMLSNTFVDYGGDLSAFAYVEYRDPMGYKAAAAREPGGQGTVTMSPLPQPGESIYTGNMRRNGLEEHVLEVGLGIEDGLGIPPRFGVVLTYTWMPYEKAVNTTPQMGG